MTLNDLLTCARPLYMETDIDGVDYAQLGSCALMCRGGQRMIFTARHCLWKSPRPCEASIRATIEHLWIPENLCIPQPVSFGLTNPRVAHAKNYQAASDVAVIDVLNTNSTTGPPFFCDLGVVPLYMPNLGDKLVVSGFPKAINRIDYPEGEVEGKLRPGRCDASGIFVGEGTAPFLVALQLDKPDFLASVDGMSGSPVFAVRQDSGRSYAGFAGIAVREMTARGTIDFIPAPIVARCI